MSLAINTQNLILVGMGLHLLGGLAKTVFHTPKQQAQIDAIEGKVDAVLGAVQQGLQKSLQPPVMGESEPPGPQ